MSGEKTSPGVITRVDMNLERLEERVEGSVPRRSLWQRIMLPMVGLICILVGLLFLITPIPLAILIVIGFPLLFCFHPRVERRARRWMGGRLERLRAWVRGWR